MKRKKWDIEVHGNKIKIVEGDAIELKVNSETEEQKQNYAHEKEIIRLKREDSDVNFQIISIFLGGALGCYSAVFFSNYITWPLCVKILVFLGIAIGLCLLLLKQRKKKLKKYNDEMTKIESEFLNKKGKCSLHVQIKDKTEIVDEHDTLLRQ